MYNVHFCEGYYTCTTTLTKVVLVAYKKKNHQYNFLFCFFHFQVIGDKDADGFYWGECGKRSGYVPCNMVSEVQVEDERMLQDIFKEDRRGMRGTGPGGGYGGPGGRERWGDIYANTPVKKMIALYDYDPHEVTSKIRQRKMPNVRNTQPTSFSSALAERRLRGRVAISNG